ncbi:MAG: 4-hydroxyproline epimerase [Maricaulis sp.]|jgi:4-hydroxyproline epimerase|nr:4-hydroxyproline epimerase [Maricaulis sp.]MDG2045447.1 4-hydroxyproline epimerase [Maricaulis sp.]
MRHTFQCLDGHTCGNPVRLISGGAPILRGTTMSEKRQDFIAHHDWIRQALMFEPRGHDMMSGGFIYPPCSNAADAAILFVETSGALPMCGHGTIGLVTMALENGLITPRDKSRVVLDVPAGRIEVAVEWKDGLVESVRLFNIASYLAETEVKIDCPGLGELVFDVSYGGNYYAVLEPQKNYPGLDDFSVSDIQTYSPIIRDLANQAVQCVHPEDSSVGGVSHLLWADTAKHPEADARNAVFYGARGIDRSPCGTGTSARMAQLAARGELKVGDNFVHESIIGSLFHGRVEKASRVGGFDAIEPSIGGWARQTGINTIFVDDRDPYKCGFVLG